jgi:hypothetical protein
MDYFVVLLVVIGLYRKGISPLWAAPLALWVGPQVSNGRPWQTAAVLVIVGLVFVASTRRDTRPSRARIAGFAR